ncbi:nuclease-related domain-containing protein [Nocardioides sp. JQ2195]|uniref:nuclease-related domain-containing protein n=1 Tax=Nocardioides sp. JQ2195 TaxID=2592334 RepID=UPI001980D643|nr:nuclease-related domain-containing protein [Nocardioides sp. JQ2195]
MVGESARECARRQDEKAARHRRAAERYERGADGEQATAEALEPLVAHGWVVRHDLAWPGRPRANIDHVLIGPGGVFVIDTKNWSGEVDVRSQVLRQNGSARQGAVTSVAEAADAVSAAIGGVTATGVLCFTGDRPRGEWVQDVLVCSTSGIAELLAARPLVLDADEVDNLVRRAVITLPLATDHRARKARAERNARGGTPPRRPVLRRSTRRRIRSALTRSGVTLAVVAAVVFAAPRIAPALTDLFSKDLVASVVKVGDPVDVRGAGQRPDLSVTVVSVKDLPDPGSEGSGGGGTVSTVSGGELSDGDHLVAVRLKFENTGEVAWQARAVPNVSIETTSGASFDAERWLSAGGEEFSGRPHVKPGRSVSVRALVELPRDAQTKSISVTPDGSSGTLHWEQ